MPMPALDDHSEAPRRLLLIMRHAKAEPFAEDDFRRALSSRGHAQARAMGEWLLQEGLTPAVACVSTADRAMQTWQSVAEVAAAGTVVTFDEALYSADVQGVLEVLRGVPDDTEVLLYLGHNPTAASLTHQLDDGHPDPQAFQGISRGFPPGAVAVLDVQVPWSELDDATARLRAYHAPEG